MSGNKRAAFPWAFAALFGLVVLALSAVGSWTYRREVQAIRREKYHGLKAIADLKIGQIVAWRNERTADAQTSATAPFLRSAVGHLLGSPGPASLRIAVQQRLEEIRTSYGYENVIVARPDGAVLLSLDPRLKNLEAGARELVARAVSIRDTVFGDFLRCAACDKVHLDVVAPIFGIDRRPVAALILRVDPETYLYPLIQSWPTPSRSSETLLVRRDGNSALFLNRLRHRPEPALTFRVPLSRADLPAVRAARGHSGEFEGLDYRGVKVLADIRAVPGSPWFMVAKVDAEEVLAEAHYHGVAIFAITLLAVLLTASTMGLVYYYSHRNLYASLLKAERERAEAQEAIRATLYSIGDAVIATDTAGLVVRMNPEAERLTGWSETEAMGRPLDEVFRIVNEQTRAVMETPVQRVMREGHGVGLANYTVLLSRDGLERPIADSGAPIRDERGEITGVVLVFRDQTEERRRRAALRDSESRFRALFEHMAEGCAYCRMVVENGEPRDFVYLAVNRAFETLTGLKDVTGRKVSEVIPGIRERNPELFGIYVRVALTGNAERFETLVETLGKWLSVSAYSPEKGYFVAVLDDITERRLAEQTLRESEYHYRELTSSLPQLIWTCAPDGACDYLGPQWIDYTGIPAQQQLGHGWTKQVHPEDLSHVLTQWAQSVQTGSFFETEFRIRRADGVYRRFKAHAAPLRDTGGKLVKWFGTNSDIDDQKRAEQELERSRQMLQVILDTIPQGVFWKDRDGRFLGCNRRFARDAGVARPEDMVGLSDFDMPWKEHAEAYRSDDRQVIETGVPKLAYEEIMRGSDAPPLWVLTSKVPLPGSAGEVIGVLGGYEDITALHESEDRFRRAVTESPFPTLLHAEDGEVLQVSNVLCEITGYSRDELRTIADWTERAYGERRPAVQAIIDRLYSLEHRQSEGDYIIRTRSGAQRIWEFSSAPLGRLRDGRRAVISMAMDVTERRRAEEETRRLSAELEQRVADRTIQLEAANRELEAFAYSVSHDLRAPLRALDGFSGALISQYRERLDEQGRHYLDRIREGAERMSHLVDDLLDLSRITRHTLEQQRVDLSALARAIACRLQAGDPERQAEFVIGPDLAVDGDPRLLNIALENLLDNAWKFTGPCRNARIEVGVREQDAERVFFVRDNGVGFDMAYAGKLFAPFQRLHGMREFPGTGIGLATAQRIISRHGGRVWAQAAVGEGATFCFTLRRVS